MNVAFLAAAISFLVIYLSSDNSSAFLVLGIIFFALAFATRRRDDKDHKDEENELGKH